MTARRKKFDWRKIHDGLEARMSRLGSTYEHDPARMHAVLRARSAALAAAPAEPRAAAALVRLLVFRTGAEKYGLALHSAREIARLSKIATLPGAPAAMLGIINWRGEFVTVFDLARLLGLSRASDSPLRYVIVLRGEEPRVAVAVEELEGLAALDLTQLQTPDRPGAKAPSPVKGISADAMLVLDEDRLQARLQEDLRAA